MISQVHYWNNKRLTKVCVVKTMVFPAVMYECESWTIKKAEHRRIDAFELWCWRRLLMGCAGFPSWWRVLLWSVASGRAGFSSCSTRTSSCTTRAWLLCGLGSLSGPGIEPMSPALVGGFLSTVPPGQSLQLQTFFERRALELEPRTQHPESRNLPRQIQTRETRR